MIVQTRIAGSSGAPDAREIPVDATVTTLRGLLAVLVRHELEQYEAHRGASHTLEVLTPADLAHGVDTGRYGREKPCGPAVGPEPSDRRGALRQDCGRRDRPERGR
jgi:hypothetical protein